MWLWLTVALFVAGSYVAQRWTPPPAPRIVGIDLGTTYSCVAVYYAGSGDVEVVRSDNGLATIPSVVLYEPSMSEDAWQRHSERRLAALGDGETPTAEGSRPSDHASACEDGKSCAATGESRNEVDVLHEGRLRGAAPNLTPRAVVGWQAKALMERFPLHAIYEAKRFIGRPFQQAEQKRFPFQIVADARGDFAFNVPDIGVKTPIDVAAEIVAVLKRNAELQLRRQITEAVLAVPAEFTRQQREATEVAAHRGGIRVLRMLSEPTAAALAYGLHEKDGVGIIVVYDFGGGTLDVAVLGLQNGLFTTLAVAGNKELGGEDISHALFLHVLAQVEVQLGGKHLTLVDRQHLRTLVDRGKIELSSALATTITLPVSTPLQEADLDQTRPSNPSRVSTNITYQITRDLLESVCGHIFAQILEPVERALQSQGLSPTDVDEVVLVGGSTRIPKVREMLSEFFGKMPNVGINPDEAVARGVAIQAGILAGAWPVEVAAIEDTFEREHT